MSLGELSDGLAVGGYLSDDDAPLTTLLAAVHAPKLGESPPADVIAEPFDVKPNECIQSKSRIHAKLPESKPLKISWSRWYVDVKLKERGLDSSAENRKALYQEWAETDQNRFKCKFRVASSSTSETIAKRAEAKTPEAVARVAEKDLFVGIPLSYVLDDLHRDFGSHSFRSGEDDSPCEGAARWRLYCTIVTLIERRAFESQRHAYKMLHAKYPAWKIGRDKLAAVASMLRQEGTVPASPPSGFKMGRKDRGGTRELSDIEKEDMLRYVKYHEQCATNLSVADCENTLSIMLVKKDLGVVLSRDAESLATLPEVRARYGTGLLWRSFKQWVKTHRPEEDALSVARLRPWSDSRIRHCTRANVAKFFDDIEELCTKHGICNSDGVLVDGDRLIFVDEKGFSPRARASGVPGIVSKGMGRQGFVQMATPSFPHISVVTFAALSGRQDLRPGVITATKSYNEELMAQWPDAIFEHSPKGSMNEENFALMIKECCIDPLRNAGVQGTIVIVADSGGGTLLHLSASLVVVLLDGDAEIYILASDLTCAVMALDQLMHQKMQELWANAMKIHSGRMSLYQGIAYIKELHHKSVRKEVSDISFRDIGFVLGSKINRMRVLHDRGDSLFRGEATLQEEASKSFTMRSSLGRESLEIARSVKPRPGACATCKGSLYNTDMYCSSCGAENEAFDLARARMNAPGHHKGWTAERDGRTDMEAIAQRARNAGITRHVGLFKSEILRRKSKAEEEAPLAPPVLEAASASSSSDIDDVAVSEALAAADVVAAAVDPYMVVESPMGDVEEPMVEDLSIHDLSAVAEATKAWLMPHVLKTSVGAKKALVRLLDHAYFLDGCDFMNKELLSHFVTYIIDKLVKVHKG